MLYKSDGKKLNYPNIVGDGVIDDTEALQYVVDHNKTIKFTTPQVIRITSTITIDLSKIQMFDGGNSTFVIDGDFVGFELSGDYENTYKKVIPDDFWTNQYYLDVASFNFVNCKIKNSTGTSGVGVRLTNCVQANIRNCLFRGLNTGVVINGTCRNLIIEGCHFWYLVGSGVEFNNTSNTHQININNNHISFCKYGVFVNNPNEIANWQFDGNDVELNTYPSNNKPNERAVYVYSDNTKTSQMSEFEMCGNTIQGHDLSNIIIEIVGGTNRYIGHTSIVGNHISNALASGNLIKISRCKNFTIDGNSFKSEVSNVKVILIENSDSIAVVGNSFVKIANFIQVANNSKNVSIVGNAGECQGVFSNIDNTCVNVVSNNNAVQENVA